MSVARFRQIGPFRRRAVGGVLAIPLMLVFALAFLALAYVAYVLWPRWPAAAIASDAPALPIVVSGVAFNIPPAAIRVPVQRHAGTQERVDLAFEWPSLAAPDPQTRIIGPRLFVTIEGAGATLAPRDRLKLIYPRYAAPDPQPAPEGLARFAFRDGTPYEGEDLLVDAAAPENFAVRCTRDAGPRSPGTCLDDRRIGEADIVLRFPRAWLVQWRAVGAGIDRLLATLHPDG